MLSSARWSSFRLSKHFVALALAERGEDVLYVDPPVSPLSVLRDPTRRADLVGVRDEVAPSGVRVWRPVVAPGQNGRVGQPVNGRLLARGVRRRVPGPDLVVAFSLESRGLVRRLGGTIVYYCTDSLEDLPGTDPAVMRARELDLANRADVVVACSLPLAEQLRERGVEAVYVPHGCDEASFAGGPVPADLAPLPRPIVGYVGSLNFRIDPTLLGAAADAAAPGTLVVIGGRFGPSADPALAGVARRANVVALGHRDAERLPSYLAALDVGVVPYADLAFNRKSFPIKVLQYLAAGVPVVSTPNGATDELAPHVGIATDAASFRSAVQAAIGQRGPEADGARRAVAGARPWSAAVAAMLDAVGDRRA